AARLAQNMTDSLSVPTATSFRDIPVDVLAARRKDLNGQLAAAGKKISFTHLVGFAIVRAAREYPVMTHAFQEMEGKPHRLDPHGVNLGLAVDVERKDGSRSLVVPVIKHAEAMDFATFHATYETLVEKARANRLLPDAFAGATITLTNPGTLGTVASVPRRRGNGIGESHPQFRAPRRAPRPARLRAAGRSGARSRALGTHARGHGPHPRRSAADLRTRPDPGRRVSPAARDVLRHDVVRSRAHRQPPGARVAAAGDRIGRAPPPARREREEETAVPPHGGRDARALPAQGVSRPEAVLDRGSGRPRPDPRPDGRARRREWGASRGARHGAP